MRRYFWFDAERTLMTTEECLFNIITVNFYIRKLKLLPLRNFHSRKGQVLRDVYIHLSLNSWTTSYMKSRDWLSGSVLLEKLALSFPVLGNNCPLSTDLFTVTKLFLYQFSLNCIFLLINLYDFWALWIRSQNTSSRWNQLATALLKNKSLQQLNLNTNNNWYFFPFELCLCSELLKFSFFPMGWVHEVLKGYNILKANSQQF